MGSLATGLYAVGELDKEITLSFTLILITYSKSRITFLFLADVNWHCHSSSRYFGRTV